MKIKKQDNRDWYYHYYNVSKTNIKLHGLYNEYYILGYRYHEERKGFWLKYKKYL